jgi:uncharacterized membrane protein
VGDGVDELREEHRESHQEAGLAVAVVVVLQLTVGILSLQQGWKLAGAPGWVWFIPVVFELALLVALWARVGQEPDEQEGGRRRLVLLVLAVLGGFNVVALVALIFTLTASNFRGGGQLLLEAAAVWTTNVVAFGLGYWELDRGGPRRRVLPDPPPPDFRFPQMEEGEPAAADWHPRLLDYVYVSFTNATAFSPTDAMPLTRRVKSLMLIEAALSALTILLVAARAVNILR